MDLGSGVGGVRSQKGTSVRDSGAELHVRLQEYLSEHGLRPKTPGMELAAIDGESFDSSEDARALRSSSYELLFVPEEMGAIRAAAKAGVNHADIRLVPIGEGRATPTDPRHPTDGAC